MAMSRLRDNFQNNGASFSREERKEHNLQGLLPPVPLPLEKRATLVLQSLDSIENDLQKYHLLMKIESQNATLFYYVIQHNLEKILPFIYTPTVGAACMNFSLVYGDAPRGLYLDYTMKGNLKDVMKHWPHQDVQAICVTDGERILGLGDLGAYGMGIPIGKLAIYSAVGGVNPKHTLPITLDVGTNTQRLLDDEMYFGLKQARVSGPDYVAFVDEFMKAATELWGKQVLIQFEDFGNHNAFELLSRYEKDYCVFNDDIQGTACVTVAAMIAAVRQLNTKVSDTRVLFAGAGEAAIGIAELLIEFMVHDEGVPFEKAKQSIFMVDSRGLIVKNRSTGGLNGKKPMFAHEHKEMTKLNEIVAELKPAALIGVSAQGGSFTTEILQSMSSFNKRPIIFALSNPTVKAECTAQQALDASEGRAIFASGSPFANVALPNGKMYHPTQCNNAYVFPGLGMGLVLAKAKMVPVEVFLGAAKSLAAMTTAEHAAEGRLFPPASQLIDISALIAVNTLDVCDKLSLSTSSEVPKDGRLDFVKKQQYHAGEKQSKL